MANPWKERVLAYNRKRAEANEMAKDLLALLDALPPGQIMQLLRDEACAAILMKYGITGKEE